MARPNDLIPIDPRIDVAVDGEFDPAGRCVIYWMQRSQRGHDNAALNVAIVMGNKLKLPVLAVFAITPKFPRAQLRHYQFLVDGLTETRDELEARGVPFVVRIGRPDEVMLELAHEVGASAVVGDENPLRVGREWRDGFAAKVRVPYLRVDSDVVIPTSLFPKEEYAARTIRPKIHRVWETYLKPLPKPRARNPFPSADVPKGEDLAPEALLEHLKIGGVGPVPGYRGGPVEGQRRLKRFIAERLPTYATDRNHPTPYMTSELSAHLHFGQISPLTVALAVLESGAAQESVDAYIEELIVRREVAINFVARNPSYDRLEGCPEWARLTLAEHASDPRPHRYSPSQFEAGETSDPLWNAAQKEMVLTGRMHNYLRMYWGKKLLEWGPDAASAFDLAVELNDKYEMDGRDPNGYTGIAWAIGGKHDRPWPKRPIYGTVRSMSYEGCLRKFDAGAYVARVRAIEKGTLPPA